MTELLVIGLAATLFYMLERRVKSRQWRKWLGITLTFSGVAAAFQLPYELYEINVGIVYLFAWLGGLSLFFERGRYEDEE